jgi:hypothetical protein
MSSWERYGKHDVPKKGKFEYDSLRFPCLQHHTQPHPKHNYRPTPLAIHLPPSQLRKHFLISAHIPSRRTQPSSRSIDIMRGKTARWDIKCAVPEWERLCEIARLGPFPTSAQHSLSENRVLLGFLLRKNISPIYLVPKCGARFQNISP